MDLQFKNSKVEKEQIAYATIGNGTVNGLTSDVNRDIMDSMKITKDEGYNYDVHLNLDGEMVGVDVNDTIGKIWTAPNTAIGLTAGLIGTAYDRTLGNGKAKITTGHNAIQFENYPWGVSSITLGNSILYAGKQSPGGKNPSYDNKFMVHTGGHEEVHTGQYQFWGPLFAPVYLINGGNTASNPMEYEADYNNIIKPNPLL